VPRGTSPAAPSANATGSAAPPAAATGWVIQNPQSNWCLGVTGASVEAGADIVQGHCTQDTSQQWHVRATVTSGGYVYRQYQNGHSGLCLDVNGAGVTSGAQLVQSACAGTADHAQFWRNADTAAGGAGYHVVNYHSGYCMGIKGSALNSGAHVIQGTCSSNGTQVWLTAAALLSPGRGKPARRLPVVPAAAPGYPAVRCGPPANENVGGGTGRTGARKQRNEAVA
jgi:hypothetical protein